MMKHPAELASLKFAQETNGTQIQTQLELQTAEGISGTLKSNETFKKHGPTLKLTKKAAAPPMAKMWPLKVGPCFKNRQKSEPN